MATKEINSEDWSAFFQLFSQMERDTLVSIDHIDRTNVSSSIIQNAPLQGIEFDQSDPCNNMIRVRAGTEATPIYLIVEPIHVKIRQDSNHRKILQIDAEIGTTEIKFHSGRLEEMLHLLKNRANHGA